MLLAEAVSLSGEVIVLAFIVLLVALLMCVTVVVGTVVAARRYGRTGSATAGVVAALGASLQLLVFFGAAVDIEPITMAISGGALLMAGTAYSKAKRSRPTP